MNEMLEAISIELFKMGFVEYLIRRPGGRSAGIICKCFATGVPKHPVVVGICDNTGNIFVCDDTTKGFKRKEIVDIADPDLLDNLAKAMQEWGAIRASRRQCDSSSY